LISRNSIPFCAVTACSEFVHTFMPSATGVAQAAAGAFDLTRHIRQLAAIDSFL
jgi:hypothetical protein